MSSSSYSSIQFANQDFKSGAHLWFSSTLDTTSPWGTSFPLSVPAQPKKVGVLPPSPAKPVQQQQQQTLANDFVQLSSNQRWNTQNIFGQIQNDSNKKIPKAPAATPQVVSAHISSAEMSNETTPLEEDTTPQNLYKTEMCRSFEETGSCRYGMKCQFAHSSAEIRYVTRHPKYKTEVCKTFHTIGTCPYGKRCRFIHSEAPLAPLSASAKTNPAPALYKPEIKTPVVKKASTFQNINSTKGAPWTSTFPAISTPVNFQCVEKGFVPKAPVDEFSSANIMKESHERRSRLGIFQQICSWRDEEDTSKRLCCIYAPLFSYFFEVTVL